MHIKRFNEIHQEVRGTITNDFEKPEIEKQVLLKRDEEMARTQYIRGLNSEIQLIVKSQRPPSFHQAQESTEETGKEM